MGQRPRKDLIDQRKKDAAERLAVWNTLSPKDKLSVLDRRLGLGVGAKKERTKLAKLIAAGIS